MARIERAGAAGRTVTLKVKFSDFRIITRARSFAAPVSDRASIGAAGHSLPALALTAYAREEDRQRALQAGFQNHVAKPVHPAELVRLVADMVAPTRER